VVHKPQIAHTLFDRHLSRRQAIVDTKNRISLLSANHAQLCISITMKRHHRYLYYHAICAYKAMALEVVFRVKWLFKCINQIKNYFKFTC
jgi:hypothetical protein